MIEIVRTGPLATVQDLGRPGWAALGVPRSGAFDRVALRLANRLVGNPEDRPGLEITLGGLALRTDRPLTLALTGAVCSGSPDHGVAISVPAGGSLTLGTPVVALRTYLAVRGGLDVSHVLGSASTDTLSGLGPPALAPGARLAVGAAFGDVVDAPATTSSLAAARIRVTIGPRDDWFTDAAVESLLTTAWEVRPDSDRVGVRLAGPPLERLRDGELASEATLPGAIQVPPDGRPILFGPDAPVTGGYPVIAVADNIAPAAQLRPGAVLHFVR